MATQLSSGDCLPWQTIHHRLNQYDHQGIDSLCLSCFDRLKNGHKDDHQAPEEVRALMQLIIHAVKRDQTDSDIDTQHLQHFQPYFRQRFRELFRQHRDRLITSLIDGGHVGFYDRYVQLKWRFEVKMAGKYVRQQFEPYVILSFYTTDHRNQLKCIQMQCTIADLYHMQQKIADVIERNHSSHSIKLIRNIKM